MISIIDTADGKRYDSWGSNNTGHYVDMLNNDQVEWLTKLKIGKPFMVRLLLTGEIIHSAPVVRIR